MLREGFFRALAPHHVRQRQREQRLQSFQLRAGLLVAGLQDGERGPHSAGKHHDRRF